MADEKITQLTAATTPLADTDLFVVVQEVGGTPVTRKVAKSNIGIGEGYIEFLSHTVPTTSGAPVGVITGASSPAESVPYIHFVNGSVTYVDFLCRLRNYQGGGLTFNFNVLRTTAAAAATYILEMAIRRINNGTEDLGAAHTYDYNQVTVTIPSGPPNAGIPMAGVITFTHGADMDSLANNEAFILRFRRNGGTATDTCRVLASVSGVET